MQIRAFDAVFRCSPVSTLPQTQGSEPDDDHRANLSLRNPTKYVQGSHQGDSNECHKQQPEEHPCAVAAAVSQPTPVPARRSPFFPADPPALPRGFDPTLVFFPVITLTLHVPGGLFLIHPDLIFSTP